MTYEKLAVKNGSPKDIIKKDRQNRLEEVNTRSIVWHLVKRHKFGIVVVYAITISVFYLAPFVPDSLFALIGR